MDGKYQNVLRRLKEEREKLNLTQRLLCYRMKMLQSHYSRAESGNKRFSYYEIKGLCTSDVDVLYVFTGKKATDGEELSELQECGPEELICYLNTLYSLAKAVKPTDARETAFGAIRRQLEFVQCGSSSAGAKNNIFYCVRIQKDYTQQKMADLLGVDIKKLRELENGRILPDSEMIWKMYDLFRVSPAFILEDTKGLWKELNYSLDLLEEDDRKIAVRILTDMHRLLRR
ncbi:MAG: helix-turn-helix domain-containing protein [Eubacterium sp.]|nr:helix-turn-helix domain-containing protein [Eubacterium sp.]MCM1216344.1 helix-turn-helix domain-containing protein [Lachnospiraceae bacterium]MCM1305393.1 helix-turn-helix domain-containing protein [Butyrivibrio sp.]MCM1342897.1 helix-turn-helix domain-containing protein [Muribaculaceae bacterium]MCM1240111.1 helix-turn-helix domain-containing protein [Lachnospiraceae bacterium]